MKMKLNRENDRGAALVEFALTVPVVMLILIGAIDLGLAQFYTSTLTFAAESAARCRAIESAACPDDPATVAYAAAAAPLPGVSVANFSVTRQPCGVMVRTSYTYRSMILPAIPIAGGVCYP
jgi:Flp pilus assembly protein TadG